MGGSRTRLWAGFAAGALLATLSACSADDEPNDDDASGGSAGTAGTAGAGGKTPAGSIGIGTLTQTCGTSALGRPLLRRLTRGELQNTLDDIFPQVKGKWTVKFPDVESSLGLDNDPALLTVGGQVAEQLLDTANNLATALTADGTLAQVLPCASTTPDRACAQTFVTQFGRRLFRRPLTQADQDRYLAFFDARLAASDFKSALRWLTVGLIQSPHAVYRREVGTVAEGARQLSQYEIAGELAYTFSGTTPSAELLAQAEAGELSAPEKLVGIASQMLATPAGQEVVHRFFRSWLGYDQVPPALSNVPMFATLGPDMVQETRRFIEEVVVTNRGGLKELLTAPYTTPSVALATFYGFPAPAADYAKIDRPAGRGLGVLAQGSLISAHSHEAASSPTLRGLLVFERFLCGERPQVPASVPTLVPPSPGVKTTRQRYEEQHMAAGTGCPACHQLFDPLGFGFENYDEAGRYRDQEGGLPVDASGSLMGAGAQVLSFSSLDELAVHLASQPDVGNCASGYVNAYAYANGVACLGETRRAELVAGTLGFLDYYASLAGEPSFTRRK